MTWADPAATAYRQARTAHWEAVARRMERWPGLGGAYHRRLTRVYRHVVPPGLRVLELGCGRGDLLAAVEPDVGVGVDFAEAMVAGARRRHPHLRFVCADVHDLDLAGERFDVIILSDLLNDVWDVQRLLEQLPGLLLPGGRVVLNSYSRLWEVPLGLAQRLGLARPVLHQNWLTVPDMENLLRLAGMETVRRWQEVLLPLPVPLLAPLANRLVVKLWPFRHLALTNLMVARPLPHGDGMPPPVVSVVVPARNEAGNIAAVFARTPEMAGGTELVLVEGHSTDDTFAEIQRQIAAHPQRRAVLLRQPGVGKGDAVRAAFAAASGDILIILDADLTVPPEDLPRFVAVLTSGQGDFVNGVRLVYPMERHAMRFFNLIGNKAFSLAFTWLLGQPIRDTLCGTKALSRRSYHEIARHRSYFGDFDPFGDFDLLFGAARGGLKIVEVPIRYRERTYGTTNIQRWRHGLLLLRMVAFAARRLKLV